MADTLEQIVCPACGKIMEKVFIPSEGINIDICTEGCGGIFFDNREFDAFNEVHENIDKIIEKLQNKQFEPIDENKDRICPCCFSKMVKNNAGIGSGIIVDDCYTCGGKFLDNEELLKIRAEYQNDSQRTDEAMEYIYHKVGRQLADTEKRYAKSKIGRSWGQKLFASIFDML